MGSNQVQHQTQLGAKVVMQNQTQKAMTLSRNINWSGEPSTESIPTTIAKGGKVEFTHLRDGQFGSQGAVQYDGFNDMSAYCSWLLAWQAPANNISSPRHNKVYVICGYKREIDTLTDDKLLEMLEDAQADGSYSDTLNSKTKVDAQINDDEPNTASVNANFGLTP